MTGSVRSLRLMGGAGYSLIEVVVAVLIILIAGSAIMATALTGRTSAEVVARRAQATQAIRRVADALKIHQTASTTAAPGPGVAPNGWGLPGDVCGCAAFQDGVHALDPAIWAPGLAAQGGRVSYTVSSLATDLGPQPTVVFDVTWIQP